MSAHATERMRLVKACIIRYATYLHDPQVLAELTSWKSGIKASNDSGFALIEKFNDVIIVFHQAPLVGEPTPQEIAGAGRAVTLPAHGRIGLTSVIEARRPDDLDAAASQLTSALFDGERCVMRGGVVAPGIGLWSRAEDLAWIVLLHADTDAAEVAADRILIGPLWGHEVAAHKAEYQFGLYQRLRRRLLARRKSLRKSVDALAATLDRPGPGEPALEQRQNSQTTRARRELNEVVYRARKTRSTLEAHRNNIQAMRDEIGDGAGLEALGLRRRNLDQMTAQIQTDILYAEPELDAALDVCSLHRTKLIQQSNENEKAEARRGERSSTMLAFLGLWIGVLQVFSGICTSDYSNANWIRLTAILTAVGPIGVAAWWLSGHRRGPTEEGAVHEST